MHINITELLSFAQGNMQDLYVHFIANAILMFSLLYFSVVLHLQNSFLSYVPTTCPSTGQTCSTSLREGMNKKMTPNIPMKRKAMTVMMMAVVPILFLVRVVTTFLQYGHWKLGRGCSPKVAVTRAVLWGTALTYKHTHSAIDRRTHACTHARTVTHTHTHTHLEKRHRRRLHILSSQTLSRQ